jgi:hypothetical protein
MMEGGLKHASLGIWKETNEKHKECCVWYGKAAQVKTGHAEDEHF